MKRLTLLSGLFIALGCPVLFAQSLDMKANIPFEFRIGKEVMPPGTYTVKQENGFVQFVKEGGHKSVLALTNSASIANSTLKAGLQFNDYGSARYLSKVWVDSGYARQLIRSSDEKAVLARLRPSEAGVVVALQPKGR